MRAAPLPSTSAFITPRAWHACSVAHVPVRSRAAYRAGDVATGCGLGSGRRGQSLLRSPQTQRVLNVCARAWAAELHRRWARPRGRRRLRRGAAMEAPEYVAAPATPDVLVAAAEAPRPSRRSRRGSGESGPRPDKVPSPKLDELLERLSSSAAAEAHHVAHAGDPPPAVCAKCAAGVNCTTVGHSCGQLGRAARANDADAAIAVATSLVARGHRCDPAPRRSSASPQNATAWLMRGASAGGPRRAASGARAVCRAPTAHTTQHAPARATHAAALTPRRVPSVPVAQHVFPGLDAADCGAWSGAKTSRRGKRAAPHGGLRCVCSNPAPPLARVQGSAWPAACAASAPGSRAISATQRLGGSRVRLARAAPQASRPMPRRTIPASPPGAPWTPCRMPSACLLRCWLQVSSPIAALTPS